MPSVWAERGFEGGFGLEVRFRRARVRDSWALYFLSCYILARLLITSFSSARGRGRKLDLPALKVSTIWLTKFAEAGRSFVRF